MLPGQSPVYSHREAAFLEFWSGIAIFNNLDMNFLHIPLIALKGEGSSRG